MDVQQLSSTLSASASGIPAPSRLAPAVVRGRRVYVECPAFCTVDHVASPEGFIEDIWHMGDHVDLHVPVMGRSPELMAFAAIEMDAYSADPAKRQPYISVEDSSADGFDMTPEQALVYANNLEAFAAQIREMARIARGEA